MARTVALLALVAMSGCSALVGYPGAEDETSYAACHDGRDNDFDDAVDCEADSCAAACVERCDLVAPATGRIDEDQDGAFDCDDTDCDGRCPEEELARCADGRDQDGDGLVDLEDPGCWPFAAVRVESCTSVQPVDRTFDFDGVDESWAHRGAVIRPDPTGRFDGDSFVVDTVADSSIITLGDEIASAVVGLRVRATMYFDGARSSPIVGATISDPSDEATGYSGLGARIERRGALSRVVIGAVGIDGVTDSSAITWNAPEGWYDFELAVPDAGHLTLRVTDAAGDEVASLSATLTRHLDDAHRFEPFLHPGLEAGDLVVVGEVRWHGEPYRPCGVETPSSTAAFRSSVLDAAVLPETLCLLSTTDGQSLSLARSADRGLTVTPALPEDVVSMRAPLAAARAPDGSLVVISQEVRGLFPSSRHFVSRSEDCTRLSDVTSFELPGARVVGMRVLEDGYELVRTNTTRTQGAPAVLDRITRDGELRESIPLGAFGPGEIFAVLLGNNVIFTNEHDPGRIAVTSIGAEPSGLDATIAQVEPSGRAGACDERTVLPAVLTLDPSPIVADAIATGLVLVPFCDATYSGLVAHRLTVRPRD